ncbi:MoaD/ThiS family protein [Pseudotamlana carrageenivorans]|uniref:MoaD/ThiS family protein n=1 Tax=Pseudotamlana carrageenivorans TaxID=2069432 RepID=A0A2I7SDT0_9FLAO|nr:MoaD/ThiS family protein [Tamlana carrageenivorans]AUS04053.1 MoaD/ThiS family protein [Tamlana carrageenivorans]
MLLTIKYFGLIAEVTQKSEETLEFSGKHISELLTLLYAKYEALKTKDFQVAQNQELVATDALVSGQEIALLPPFAGG